MATEVIEMEPVILAWAQEMFKHTKTKEMGKIPKDALMYTVNWKNVRVHYSKPEYNDVNKAPTPKSQILFKTTFVNNTKLEQEYSFKTQRTTQSCCEVSIEKGVSTGVEFGLKLATPCEIFEANAGFHREITVTNSETETIEHEMSWEVDSQIKVPARHKTEAHLVVNEDNQSSKFTVHCRMKGMVTVVVTNMQDNNSFLKSLDGSLAEIFRREIECGLRGVKVDGSVVSFDTVGKCSFRYAVEQHVKLHQEEIPDDE